MNIEEYIPNEYIPAIITASVALLAAVLSQVINNFLTYKRENKKYLNEIYGDFISRYFSEVIAYGYAISTPGKEHNLKTKGDISETINGIFQSIHYGDKYLQANQFEYSTWKYLEDHKGDAEEILQFKVCYNFLVYSKNVFNKIDFSLENSMLNTLNYSIKKFGYLYICAELEGKEEAIDKITSIEFFNINVLNEISCKKINRMILRDDYEHQKRFINRINTEIEKHI
ncbi:hypothetical protein [Sporosarcina ureae]|uniref:hypothetical protein n=1 Tax=Sporosarcina ureae TaxID=1571 RepID=UPI0009DC7EFB|nr:hypothetical protein [Sporosarcina ureae]ARF16718.1 hypothetical protein SporoP17a_05070 [Sporosarcina ureae]